MYKSSFVYFKLERLHTTVIQVLPAHFLPFPSRRLEWVLGQGEHISQVIANFTSSSTTSGDWIGCVAYNNMIVNEYR